MKRIIGIGALGGSGTRALGRLFQEAGIYMGDRLNGPFDNEVFAALFRNPDWLNIDDEEELRSRLHIFRKYMENDRLSLSDLFLLARKPKNKRPFDRGFFLKRPFLKRKDRDIWGWKEPNTQHYIEFLDRTLPNFHYIHVLRHGLDMAFSQNTAQLHNWGSYYGVHLTGNEGSEELAVKQLDFWIRANERALEKGNKMKGRFMVLNHSEFCFHPEREVDRLSDLVGLEPSVEERERLIRIPKAPSSLGRYKEHDLNIFRKDQLEKVQQLGFEVPDERLA